MSDELVALAQRLIGYETSEPEAISEAAGFVKRLARRPAASRPSATTSAGCR